MPRINVIVSTDLYSQILLLKTKLQKENPSKNIDFSYAVRTVLESGLENKN